MTSQPLVLPFILSAAVHAAVLSGSLLTCAGMTAFDRDMPVFFVSVESPGHTGAFGTPGAPDAYRGPEHAPGAPKAALKKPRPDSRSGHDPSRIGYMQEPAEEAGPGKEAEPGEDVREAAGHHGMQGPGGVEEGAGERGAGAPEGNPDGDGMAAGGGTGTGGTGRSSPAAVSDLPKPAYPRYSRIHGEEGTVVLEAEVTADGKPAGVRILRSSGYRHLDDAALDALERAAFIPARTLGRPVASTKRISIRFDIREREEQGR